MVRALLAQPQAGLGSVNEERASTAVEDVVAKLLHLEDRGIRTPGDGLCDMRIDDLADNDVVVALLDNAGDLALDRGWRRVEDWRSGRALVNGMAGELAAFELR